MTKILVFFVLVSSAITQQASVPAIITECFLAVSRIPYRCVDKWVVISSNACHFPPVMVKGTDYRRVTIKCFPHGRQSLRH
jgi:hypothetical protein